jgi:lipopolysaccharide biosynthesis glycosyltransferase
MFVANKAAKSNTTLRLTIVISCILSLILSLRFEAFRFEELDLDDRYSSAGSACRDAPNGVVRKSKERHILYGLSSNQSSLFEELEVSMKSVLLNAPPADPLTIHILADRAAYTELGNVFLQKMRYSPADQSVPRFPTQISIKTYNVEEHQTRWTVTIEKYLSVAHSHTKYSLYMHTVGAYYRLFAADVLPSNIDNIVYLDTDTVVMASLGNLWSRLDQTPIQGIAPLFYWGDSLCSGFMVLRLQMQKQLWEHYAKVPEHIIKSILRARPVVDDQFLLQAVHETFPESAGRLDSEWDVSVRDGPWRREPSLLYQNRQAGVSVLHFNGAAPRSTVPYYESKFPKHYSEDPFWNLAKYYVDLPWSWAYFQLASRVPANGMLFPLHIEHGMVDRSIHYGNHVSMLDDIQECSETSEVWQDEERHVLYALSGNHSSLLREFECSLKSVLLNVPPRNSLTIHIMANGFAYQGLQSMSLIHELASNTTGPELATLVRIKIYNVERFQTRWKHEIERNTLLAGTLTKRKRLFGHTIGTWFRLFASDVLPPTVKTVVYLDTDVVMMANIESIFTHLPSGDDVLFWWGESQCAGFLVIRTGKEHQERLWEAYKSASRSLLKSLMVRSSIVSDQHVLQVVQAVNSKLVGSLASEWDVSVVNPMWMQKPHKMRQQRPNGVGMLHFNGGGTSPVSFFEAGNPVHFTKDKHWNLARYYVDLPWSWAFHQMSSRKTARQPSHLVQVCFQNLHVI